MKPDVRDRLVLPMLVPVGLLLAIAVTVGSFGLVLLFNPMAVAVVLAIVVAAAIIGGFALALSRPPDELDNVKRAVIVFAGVAPIVVGVLVATDVLATSDQKVVHREPHVVAGGVEGSEASLVADEFFFEPEDFEFDAAGELTFVMVNEGAAQHTFVIEGMEDDLKLAAQPGEEDEGSLELESGSYVFYCDVPGHRESGMEGTFEVG